MKKFVEKQKKWKILTKTEKIAKNEISKFQTDFFCENREKIARNAKIGKMENPKKNRLKPRDSSPRKPTRYRFLSVFKKSAFIGRFDKNRKKAKFSSQNFFSVLDSGSSLKTGLEKSIQHQKSFEDKEVSFEKSHRNSLKSHYMQPNPPKMQKCAKCAKTVLKNNFTIVLTGRVVNFQIDCFIAFKGVSTKISFSSILIGWNYPS